MIDAIALEVAWRDPLSDAAVEGPPEFQRAVLEKRAGVRLLLSQNADLGARAWEHFLRNIADPIFPAQNLRGAYAGVPAIVVGAGPSRVSVAAFRDRALILAGGAAIPLTPEAHIGALIDPDVPVDWAQGRTIPLLYQHRVSPQALSAWQGEKWWLPDTAGLSLEEWWCGTSGFDGGWTVTTVLVAQARLMGCHPIYLVGVDLAYGETKYPGLPSHERAVDRIEVDGLMTQRDWLLAARWLEQTPDDLIRVGGLLPIDIPSGTLADIPYRPLPPLPRVAPRSVPSRKKELLQELEHDTLFEPLWRLFAPLFPGDQMLHRTLFIERARSTLRNVCTQVF